MHAGLSIITADIVHVMRFHSATAEIPGWDRFTGSLVAEGMAGILNLAFTGLMAKSLLSEGDAELAEAFFNENFVIVNPQADGGKDYYQGKFLIRTTKPEDDMNVYLRFCPDPDLIYRSTIFGRAIDPGEVVKAESLSEDEAEQVERDPNRVDLVISFKDVASIVALMGKEDVDIVGLLLDNIVQIEGNMGHLFKLGAIAAEARRVTES